MKCPFNHEHPNAQGVLIAKEGCVLCGGTGEVSEKAMRLIVGDLRRNEDMAKMLMDSQVRRGSVSMGAMVEPQKCSICGASVSTACSHVANGTGLVEPANPMTRFLYLSFDSVDDGGQKDNEKTDEEKEDRR